MRTSRPHVPETFHRVAAALSGILLLLGYAPVECVPLLFVGLIPILWATQNTEAKRSWRLGYLFGFVYSLGQFHGLYQLVGRLTGSGGLALIPWVLFSGAMATYFSLAGWLIKRCFAAERPWLIPFVWAGVEVFRSYIPVLAFPWGLLASPLAKYPALIQLAHFGTIYLVGAWIVAVNLGLLLAYQRLKGQTKPELEAVLLWSAAATLPLGSVLVYLRPVQTQPLRVTLGQTGYDMAFDSPAADVRVDMRIIGFIREARAAGSKMLILPEDITHEQVTGDFFAFPFDPDVPIVFGAVRAGSGGRIYQSAVGFDGQWHNADKVRLMLFGEYVPFRQYLPLANMFKVVGKDMSPGEQGPQPIEVGGVKIGPLLCFESLFPDLGYRQEQNGAQFLAVMSNDDWFMNSSIPEQLRDGGIWRAVETGLPVARVASLGYSLACNSKGHVIARAPLRAGAAITADLPVPTSRPSVILLPAFPLASILLTLAIPFMRPRRSSARRTTPYPQP
jgi:apolipoprotein N-acyltransferase